VGGGAEEEKMESSPDNFINQNEVIINISRELLRQKRGREVKKENRRIK